MDGFTVVGYPCSQGVGMWRWDQGRIAFFQFDQLRKLSKFAVAHDLKTASSKEASDAVGVQFKPESDDYPPWRNYARVFRTALLVADINGVAKPTKVAALLANDGQVTSDAYFHFFAMSFTDPSPTFAEAEWDHMAVARYPLLFTLKFLLSRAVIGNPVCTYSEIVGAYEGSDFAGDEDQEEFIKVAKAKWGASGDYRQERESIQILSQVSYLSATDADVTVSIDPDSALEVFLGLAPIGGTSLADREEEIMRRAELFEAGIAGIDFDYPDSVEDEAIEAGFSEGNRVERTHVVLERNTAVRAAFFKSKSTSVCDFCDRDTVKEFPWSNGLLDIHHVLPLCSGTRSSKDGTSLADLVAVCPTCHRAVHRFYAAWLKARERRDFADADEARLVYELAKKERKGA